MRTFRRSIRIGVAVGLAGSLVALAFDPIPASADELAAPTFPPLTSAFAANDTFSATPTAPADTPPANGANNDFITRNNQPQLAVAGTGAETRIQFGDCVQLYRAPVLGVDPNDATKTLYGDFTIVGAMGGAGRSFAAPGVLAAVNVTDTNAGLNGSRVPDGRYAYRYTVRRGWTNPLPPGFQSPPNPPPAGFGLCAIGQVNGQLYTPSDGTIVHTSAVLGDNTKPIVIDTVVPGGSLDLLAISDTGRSNEDNVTNPAAVPAIAATATSAAIAAGTLQIKVDHADPTVKLDLHRSGIKLTDTGGALPGAIVQDKTATLPTTSGLYGYTATFVDLAGNVSNSVLTVNIDVDNPLAPPRIDLLTEDDTGSASDDDVTNLIRPRFMVTGVEPDALVELYTCENAGCLVFPAVTALWPFGLRFTRSMANPATGGFLPHVPSAIGSRIGPGVIQAEDNWWKKTLPGIPENFAAGAPGAPVNLALGLTSNPSWRFNVRQVDLSGRTTLGLTILGAALGNQQVTSVDLNVVIDATPEPVPASPALTAASQTGSGAGPNKTSSISPTFNVAKGTGRVELLRDGKVVGFTSGAGDVTDPGPLPNGTYSYTTRSVDRAGNISGQSPVTTVTVENGEGYWLLGGDGGVFSFGNAPFFGSTGDMTLNAPIVGLAPTPTKQGYWLLGKDGGVFSFGDAGFFGSTGDQTLNSPIIGMVPTPSGHGYWLFAGDGGVFAFGDAPFQGSPASSSPTSPIVAMLATKDGQGYWLVTKSGKVYAFGTAAPITGVDSLTLNSPIVGFAATPSGKGLWLVAADGGVFSLGDASFLGSAGDLPLNSPIVGMIATPTGDGYLLLAADGGVFTYGAAKFLGSTGSMTLNAPIVGIAAS
jgi:hypothetical protein